MSVSRVTSIIKNLSHSKARESTMISEDCQAKTVEKHVHFQAWIPGLTTPDLLALQAATGNDHVQNQGQNRQRNDATH